MALSFLECFSSAAVQQAASNQAGIFKYYGAHLLVFEIITDIGKLERRLISYFSDQITGNKFLNPLDNLIFRTPASGLQQLDIKSTADDRRCLQDL